MRKTSKIKLALVALTGLLAMLFTSCPTPVTEITLSRAGGIYINDVTTKVSCGISGVKIVYTTDGSKPGGDNGKFIEAGADLTINKSCTLKLLAYKVGVAPATLSAKYDLVVAPITFSSKGENFDNDQNIIIGCATKGAIIHYTMDGSDPAKSTAAIVEGKGVISLTKSATIKAMAIKTGYTNSAIKHAEFTLKVAEPTFSIEGGDFYPTQEVTIGTTSANATIYYTTNGDIPSPSSTSTVITSGSSITLSKSTTIKAMAIKTGYISSTIKSSTFNFVFKADTTVAIAGGTFLMGSDREDNEKPVHSVTVDSFSMSPYEVTQADYQALIHSNPSKPDAGIGANYPVNNVSIKDIIEYCNKLSTLKGFTPCYSVQGNVTCTLSNNGYRLPTEAEWEYAARGGSPSSSSKFSGNDTLEAVAWYSGNSDTGSGKMSHEVGQKAPNKLGLYDMNGNVWEQCWRSYMENYPTEAQNNPILSNVGSYNFFLGCMRGGGWFASEVKHCTVSFRVLSIFINAVQGSPNVGFRLVRRP